MIAPMQVSVGKPVTFSGYAEDYGKQIVSVQFSLDNGANWTTYDVSDSTDDLWVHWTFSYTPGRPGLLPPARALGERRRRGQPARGRGRVHGRLRWGRGRVQSAPAPPQRRSVRYSRGVAL